MNKYFILCPHCEFPNEVKTQYLTFCSDCGKKLDKTFTNWHKDHPKSSFEEYLSSECYAVDEKLIKPRSTPDKEEFKPGNKVWLGTLIGIVFIIALGVSVTIDWSSLLASDIATKEVLDVDWERKTYGSLGLSIEAPFVLKTMPVKIPAEARKFIGSMESFTVKQSQIEVMLSHVQYVPSVGQANLSGATTGILNNMRNARGVSDFKYDQRIQSFTNYEGYELNGTYFLAGKRHQFVCAVVAKELKLYQVIINFPADNQTMKAVADRIIKSIEIK